MRLFLLAAVIGTFGLANAEGGRRPTAVPARAESDAGLRLFVRRPGGLRTTPQLGAGPAPGRVPRGVRRYHFDRSVVENRVELLTERAEANCM